MRHADHWRARTAITSHPGGSGWPMTFGTRGDYAGWRDHTRYTIARLKPQGPTAPTLSSFLGLADMLPARRRGRLHAGRTVNTENFAIDPLAVLRSQETHHTRNVNGLPDAVQRRPRFGILRSQNISPTLDACSMFFDPAALPRPPGRRSACRRRECTPGTPHGTCRS